MAYIELHARSAFSFLEGASLPEELAEVCAELEIPAMALLDRDGVYGVPRFHLAAKKSSLRAHIGAEVTSADGWRYPLLVETRAGYQNLCRLITRMKMAARKGEGSISAEEVPEKAVGLICLTGGEEGPLAHALVHGGITRGMECVERLCEIFGRHNVYVELQRHFCREEESRNQAAAEIARLFADLPEAIANTEVLSSRLQFHFERFGLPVPEISRAIRRIANEFSATACARRNDSPLRPRQRMCATPNRARVGVNRKT